MKRFRLGKYIPFFWKSDRPDPLGPVGAAPVLIFVSGLSSTATETWRTWFERIKNDAHLAGIRVDSFDYPTSLLNIQTLLRMPLIEELSMQLAARIREEYSQSSSITLVGHSLGGLVARRMIADEAVAGRRIEHFRALLCGSPNSGAALAELAKLMPWGQGHVGQIGLNSIPLDALNKDWSDHDIPQRITSAFVVGGADKIVEPSSACISLSDENVHYLAEADHSSIVDPYGRTYDILKQMLAGELKGSDPLFDVYQASDRPYYYYREKVDGAIGSALAHSHLWLHGPSGSGKTTLLRRNAMDANLPVITVLLGGYSGNKDAQLFRAFASELLQAIGDDHTNPPDEPGAIIGAVGKSLIEKSRKRPLFILVEEFPQMGPEVFSQLVSQFAHLTELIDASPNARGRVRFGFTSIALPNLSDQSNAAKLRERIQFVETSLCVDCHRDLTL